MQLELQKDWEAVQEILAGLPLERCSLETHPVTVEQGWHAPKKRAFRISGQFRVQSADSDVSFWIQPQESRELFLAENSEFYADFLKQCGGNKAEALKLLIEDFEEYGGEYQLPEKFDGKWLVVDTKFDEDGALKSTSLRVKREIYAWYETGYFAHIPNITPDSDAVTPCTFDSPQGVVQWQQLYAEAVLGSAKVEMVKVRDPKLKLFLPEAQDRTTINIPLEAQHFHTKDRFWEYAQVVYGVTLTAEQLLGEMRRKRESGFPFDDDPLRDFAIIRGEHNLDVLAEMVLHPKKSKKRDPCGIEF